MAGELLPRLFTLTPILDEPGRYVSVALSLSSRLLDVIQRPALWSPDFPPLCMQRSDCEFHFPRSTVYPIWCGESTIILGSSKTLFSLLHFSYRIGYNGKEVFFFDSKVFSLSDSGKPEGKFC